MSVLLTESLIAAVFLTSSCLFYYQTFFFPKTRISDIGPEYWPQLLLAGMIILSAALLVDIYKRRKALAAAEEDKKPYPLRFWYTLALAVAYTLVMPLLGFAVGTLLFCLAIMSVLGVRSVKSLLLTATGATVLFVVLFPKIMAVPMPRGIGIFRMISLFFY
ncbi:tripartite tricarboxylate transporter TctB family protein [Anaeroselena agilis]|uniref:Tripartite tricarboxylate transporter TctB family protein n=1 Tax=Anaeroselena agilis TaxID=3063788 RepID=A0ABU3P516_9FIRM|nr:tripartite tricarboxylate transporter TctB family protein [Selenomonadales bacterium 4137-cl]